MGHMMGDTTLANFDLADPPSGFADDPFPWYAALQAQSPVHRLGDGSRLLSRHADCAAVYRDGRFSSDKTQLFRPKFGDSPLFEHHTTSLVFNDPPYHTRVRRTIAEALKPKNIQPVARRLEVFVAERLVELREWRERDLIEHFAAAVPVEIICTLLSVPASERGPLRRWSLAILGALEPAIDATAQCRGNAAVREFLAYLGDLIRHRRQHRSKDDTGVLQSLIDQTREGDLSELELLHNCIFLLNAGHETTTNLIGNGIHMLITHPDSARRLRQQPGLIRSAVEEVLRYQSPNQLGNRVAAASVEVAGQRFHAGDQVTLGIGAANRDGQEFADPHRFAIDRSPNRHLAFAAGPHACAGNSLARLEGRIAIGGFVRAFEGAELAEAPRYQQRLRFRGLKSLRVRL